MSPLLLLLACTGKHGTGGSGDDSGGQTIDGVWLQDVSGVSFVATIDNPWLPFPVGATWTYDNDGEQVEVEVLDETVEIEGVTATVVRDTDYEDGELTEDTRDWFAQDSDGNVWYLGEDSCEYEDGACVDSGGSWRWGENGALPGIVMWAEPAVDERPYFQEYSPGVAEDVGEVIALDVSVETGAGTWSGCLKTRDSSLLESGAETKIYCAGIGLVQENGSGGLVSYTGL